MYAVIATGGKQYRVAPGDVIRVEKLDAAAGSSVTFERVLMLGEGESLRVGAPFIEGQTVQGRVKAHVRGEKIEIIKIKRRKNHRKHLNHRQDYTEVEIIAVAGQGSAGKPAAAKAAAKKTARKTARKTASKSAKKTARKKTAKKAARKAARKTAKKTAKKKKKTAKKKAARK